MCHRFGIAASPAIPADFFGPGSDPFAGSLCLEGVSLGIPHFGEADTLIQRASDPFDRCELPSADERTVDIEVQELSLVSTNPIMVTYGGGQSSELWNVKVDLSPVRPPVGTLAAYKTHCDGGTYVNSLYVLPRFTFTKEADPQSSRVLDTGLEGIAPVTLALDVPQPWVHDVDPNLGAMVDLCSTFHAGISDNAPQPNCDCNANTIRDKCDIETGVSADCNSNAVPDECDIANLVSTDCNTNTVPDECDVANFVGCLTGPTPGGTLPGPCTPFDAEADNDIDLVDVAVLQRALGCHP